MALDVDSDLAPSPELPDDVSVGAGDVEADTQTTPGPWERIRTWPQSRVQAVRDWWNAEWTTERTVQFLVALGCVGICTYFVAHVVHLPLVFKDNTPTGGDFGAHVMAPAYLRDHLLPEFKLSGWTNNWYAGTPLYRYYMVIPALAIVALDVIMPYGVAMKIVAVSGLLTLPACCWAFGRLARFRYPMPELFAVAGMIFLFDESFSIYGGNVKSTMAGEFSFSIALSLAVLGLGLFARGLENGRYRSLAAVVLALAMLSHGIVLIFVALGMVLMWLIWMDRTRFVYGITAGVTTVLLSAFWVLPFVFNHDYMTDMKYEGRPNSASDSFWYMFFPWPTTFDVIVTALAIAGFAACIIRRHLTGAWLGITCLALTAMIFATKDGGLPFIGLLWNPRLLPFLYLLRFMLMMVGIVEIARLVMRGWAGMRGVSERADLVGRTVVAAVTLVAVLIIQLFVFENVPGGRYATKNGQRVYSWGIGLGDSRWDLVTLSPKKKDANSDGWPAYNFEGYEGRSYYGEYRNLVLTMQGIGEDPSHGCGRAIWENYSAPEGGRDAGLYGTTMALMLLPHWTDGCITSMEGLYFEASGTTPFHFVTSAAISDNGSKPVRKVRYDDLDYTKGVPYMQALGINYLMVYTDAARRQAATRDDLTLIATSGPWEVYAVASSDLVEPLTVQPVVVNERSGDQRERHLELGMSWFRFRDEWAAMPADDGPPEWQRINADIKYEERTLDDDGEPRNIDILRPRETITPVPLPEVQVLDWTLENESLSFTVDRPGVPVLVKLSYFPNWKVEGAEGPYRIGPNMMVVVPTDTEVRMSYGRSTLDVLAYVLTLFGIVCAVVMWKRGPVRHRSTNPLMVDDPDDDDDDGADDVGSGDAATSAYDEQDPTVVMPTDDDLWADRSDRDPEPAS